MSLEMALHEWKAARTQLTNTIHSYLTACATLTSACVKPPNRSFGLSKVENILEQIDNELELLASEETKLYRARLSLSTARNRSATLILTNTIPSDILADIFTLSIDTLCSYQYSDTTVYDIMGVCTYWRDLATNTPYLWTHVDVNPEKPHSMISSDLKRTKGRPIFVHINQKAVYHHRYYSERNLGVKPSECIQALAPYMHRVHAIDIFSNYCEGPFVTTLLALWSGKHKTSPWHLRMRYRASTDGVLAISSSEALPQESLSLNTLHLYETHFDWESPVYHGLVELRLCFPKTQAKITVPRFAKLLAASPALRVLEIVGLMLLDGENQEPPSPVTLGCLEVLHLNGLRTDMVPPCLSVITASMSLVEVTVSSSNVWDLREELEAFLRRSQVVTLFYVSQPEREPLLHFVHSALQHSPSLGTLIAKGFSLSDGINQHWLSTPEPISPICHPMIVLLECEIGFDALRILVMDYGVRQLSLDACLVGQAFGQLQDELETMRTRLLGICPELQCSISDTDSTSRLACRSLVDRTDGLWDYCSEYKC